nr:hypothetical protein [Tanacetum cinerariifolium]
EIHIPLRPNLGVLQIGIKSQGYRELVMSSDSHATITYTSMSSYEVIVNGYYEMPMDPLDPYYLPPADDVLPAEEQPLPATVSPIAESPGYITKSEPEMEPDEEDGDDEKSEEDSIEYLTSGGDDDLMMMVMICQSMMLMTRRKRSPQTVRRKRRST